jgi:hypothetical protein
MCLLHYSKWKQQRLCAVKQKVSGDFRSTQGARNFGKIASSSEQLLNKRSAYNTILESSLEQYSNLNLYCLVAVVCEPVFDIAQSYRA